MICPHCIKGRLFQDDDRYVCLQCGHSQPLVPYVPLAMREGSGPRTGGAPPGMRGISSEFSHKKLIGLDVQAHIPKWLRGIE